MSEQVEIVPGFADVAPEAPGAHEAPAPSTSSPSTSSPTAVIDVRSVTKTYGAGDTAVHAVRGVDLLVQRGEYVAIMGASGSGKSTLMNVLGCLDVPTSGQYLLDGLDVAALDDHALALVRNRRIGFVFQAFNLIPRTDALTNVEIPMAYAKVSRRERRERAMAALDDGGHGRPGSPQPQRALRGQQQRVAVARSLVMSPSLHPRRRTDRQPRQRVDRRGARRARPAQQRRPNDRGHHPRGPRRAPLRVGGSRCATGA